MSTTIDQRVVEMRFDNKQFEQNVSTTMSSLDKLKGKLNFNGATQGLEELRNTSKKIDFSEMETASYRAGFHISDVFKKVSSVIEYEFAYKIKNAITNTLRDLTITPLTTGFNEYELKMGSIQTIMASTGESLETVNGYLNELNEYSDKTIYSFSDMTSNIGKFTNAGISLDKSVAAIQGVSNVAALSGANANEASRAMYNFSQALSAGYVKLIDWKSIENANMATVGFKEQLLETAVSLGTVTKTSDGMYKTLEGNTFNATKNFNEVLQDQWMTSEVLIQTLGKYSDETTDIGKKATQAATEVKTFSQMMDTLKESAQSGWAQTWEILFGDFEEGKSLWTNINNVVGDFIGKSAEARNELLENWDVLGGRTDVIESFKNIWSGILDVITPIKEAFREIFPPLTAEQLADFTKGLRNLTEKFKMGEETADKLKRTFKGLFAVIDIIKQAASASFKAFMSLFGGVGKLGGGILNVTASFGDWLVKLSEFTKFSNIFNKIFTGIATVFKSVGRILGSVLGKIFDLFGGVGEAANGMASLVGKAFDFIGTALENCTLFKVLEALWNGIQKLVSGLMKVIKILMDGLVNTLSGSSSSSILDVINTIITGGIGVGIIKFLKSLTEPLKGFQDILDGITGILDGVRGCFEAWQTSIKADALKKIATAIAILAASLLVLSIIDGDKLAGALLAITILFIELTTALTILSKSFTGVKGLASLMTIGNVLKKIATSMLILAIAAKILGSMSIGEIFVALVGVAGGLTILVTAVNLLPEKKVISAAKAIRTLSTALVILALGLKIMGSMNIEQMGVALLGMVVGLAALVGAVHLLPKDIGLRVIGIMSLATAIVILASALKIMGTMSWGEIAVGLTALVGGLAAMVLAARLLPKDMGFRALGILSLATAVVILAGALKIMGSMSWDELIKSLVGLAGAMTILSIGINTMKSAIPGALAMLIVAPALLTLTGVLFALGSMSWESIVKGLVSLAGAFTIIGIAGLLLKPLILPILGLAGAITLMGVGILAAGAGLMAFGAGLTALSVGFTALVGSLAAVVSGIVGLVSAVIVGIIKGLGEGIVAFCEVIADGATAIGKAIKAVILTVCDVLVECVPVIADAVLQIVVGLLDALVEYSPKIIASLFQLLLNIINGIAEKIPDLIKAAINLLMSFFAGVIDALQSIDTGTLIKAIAGIGLLAGLMLALSAVAGLVPGAMIGVIGMGLVIAELALVLAAIGALAQIPGLDWLIKEGGNFLQIIGTAIGQFIGGILGGIAKGFTGSLPQIGSDLSLFMQNLKPFIEGAKLIDPSVVDGVKSLVGVILSITAANIIEGLTSWLTGGSSIVKFGEDITALGRGLKGFSDSTSGINAENVKAAANAAKVLAEMTETIPNEGGIISWFTGENSIAKFGSELPALGKGLKGFSDAVVGIVPENIIAAAESAKVLAEMTQYIPNEGGLSAWFAGDNSISKFGEDIIALGKGLKGFSDAIVGANPENMICAVEAAKALADMTQAIPNEGGVASWFGGDNSISKFGEDIIALGKGLKGFSDAIVGVVPENVTAAANAAKALADMTSTIPNQGGVVAWFAGDASIATFAGELPKLGRGLKGFSDATAGINPETITAASNAAKSLAQMASYIPNQGGIVAWFTGESSISKFGNELTSLGKGLKGFADATAGINAESMTAATNSAKALAEMTQYIPSEGGIVSWFTGESSIANFADKLPKLGKGLKGFSDSVNGINTETMTAAANAAKALAEMTQHIPKEGGIKAWFTGETNVANFADKLPTLGKGLKGFSESVKGISPENVTAAASAAKDLAEMTETVPKDTDKIITFGDNLVTFGGKLSSYIEKTSGITAEATTASKSALGVVKEAAAIDPGNLTALSTAIEDASEAMNKLSSVPKDCASNFTSALEDLGKSSTKTFINAFDSLDDDLEKKAKAGMDGFIDGIEGKESAATKACKAVVTACAEAISEKSSSFETAGKNICQGLADGISANSYLAEAKARAMAKAAAKAAKEALDINSPSKIFRSIGYSVPEGFAMGIDKLSGMVEKSSVEMTNESVNSVRNSISRIADVINSDIDAQPTIRPVLDLSDVRAGANSIGSMFASGSIGVLTNVGSISTMMNRRSQNGANTDVINALDKIGKDIKNMDRTTYNFGGISYTEGDDVAAAFETIIRAAKVERRK